ncbi:hypothetical protein BXZ70DRAFT_165827 [Cristinia sonorae]|uniref:Uncharacterized protein n=1 Tax=Cristinia sonorae TaxID=1940300 RepID=A0A8K0UPK8_9AGAR|nr:hypothetical protein BXZ70DRAFT_165827 [Cristinia sonorae]
MATADSPSQNSSNPSPTSPKNDSVSDVSNSLEKISLQAQTQAASVKLESHDPSPRRLHIYRRPHVLLLSKSPLVKTPDGMPSLKDWFGDWHEQQISSKKDPESSGTATGARDRRFRRDADDSELPARPAFRTTLSQPSQMGNFRHQPIRTADRDKDKDTDKERERDIRDKEGAEKLRNLSDKYDRDRLALNSTSLRNKDRDSAPHLTSGPSNRLGQGANGTRRPEGRESAKRKPGESEDWRRGTDSTRSGREDRADTSRRDRDARDKPRSRSRARRDPSNTRRERDRDREDHRREREEYPRRDKDDYFRRDWEDRLRDKEDNLRERRDHGDRDAEEDPRRWRDDGKRDERMAARRERGWDRWEPGNDRDRADDGRAKRAAGRDRRPGGGDDGRDKDDRREREKEKEPAWMETYVPSSPGSGILGGQTAEGELDGIQAWKKGLKEKERKEKDTEDIPELPSVKPSTAEPVPVAQEPRSSGESQLDEIQMFKLMMKREAEKKGSELLQNGIIDSSLPSASSSNTTAGNSPHHTTEPNTAVAFSNGNNGGQVAVTNGATQGESTNPPVSLADNLRSLLASAKTGTAPQAPAEQGGAGDAPQPAASRVFPNGTHNTDQPTPVAASSTSSFNPPPGSRLLAFARPTGPVTPTAAAPSKTPNAIEHPVPIAGPPGMTANASTAVTSDHSPNFPTEYQYGGNTRMTPSESSFASRSYSPYGGMPAQAGFVYDEIQDARLPPANDPSRRTSGVPPSESNSPYQELGNGNGAAYDLNGNPAGGNYAAGKGSRFAKFFDAKREPQANPNMRRTSAGPGFVSTSPHPAHRQDPMSMNGMGAANPENRTMEDIFAMLQNSAQSHRMSPQIGQPHRVPVGGVPFGQSNAELHAMQLQQLQQHQLAHNRLDSFYDSRLDDRSFVPDGMVPGLRPVPRPRSREPSGVLYNENLDDLQLGMQRIPQQARNLEQMYGAGPMFNQHANPQAARNVGIQLQQAQFRGGPSPLQGSMPIPGNRLPPGLANLGGRPPHDPSQFINSPMGVPGLHAGISPNASAQQQGFNNFGGGGNLGFGGNPQGRGPIPGPHHQNPLALNQLAALGSNNAVDLRGPSQAQFLGMGGVGGLGGISTVRGGNFNPQHGLGGQIPGPHLAALRQQQQQQQQHLPHHLVQQMLPPHLQPPQGLPGGNAQGAQDLMALLMGNHRD